MLIKYRGGRSHLRVTYGRRMFHFTPSNKFTLDIKDQQVRDFIFKLPNSFEFEAVEREPLQEVETLKKETVVLKKEFGYGSKKL